MKSALPRLLLAILCAATATLARADMAEPDIAFGNRGTASMPLPCPPNTCYQFLGEGRPLAVRADGRFLLVGTSALWGVGTPNDIVVLQRLADGSPDPSFGQDGVARPHANDYWHQGSAIALRPDGRIVVAGRVSKSADASLGYNLTLISLLPDGSLDPAFPNGGRLQFGDVGNTDAVHDMIVQANGRAIVAYSYTEAAATRVMLVAFDDRGRVDESFGTFGAVFLGSTYARVSLAQDAQGRIAASFSALPQGVSRVRVMDANGAQLFLTQDFTMDARTVAFDAQGRILVGGSFGQRPGLRRFTALGAIDATFADQGSWTHDDGASVSSLVALANGRIVGAGGVGRPVVWRWLADGRPDPDFRGQGQVTVWPTGSESSRGMQVATHPTGGLLLAINSGPSVQFTGIPSDDTIQAAKLGGFTYPINEAAPYVAQLYRDLLGREADYGGLAHWSERVAAGESRAAVAESFMNSSEFYAVVPPLVRLVFSWTNRMPTYAELYRAARRVRSGESMSSLARSYAFLPDAYALYNGLTDEQFLDRMYALVLGRVADPQGKAYWLARMAEGMHRADVMLSVSESGEHRALVAAEVLVTATYAGLLRRVPEAGGFDYWVGAIEGGASGRALIEGILGSAEYQNRFRP